MSGHDRTNTGIISKNDRKTEDRHPDIKGNADVCCPGCGQTSAFWVDGWRKQRKSDGQGFYSLSFKAKDQQQAPTRPQRGPDLDDDIPF